MDLNKIHVPGPSQGQTATQATLKIMREMILEDATSSRIISLAAIFKGTPIEKITGIYHWMMTNIKYVSDPAVDEWLQGTSITLHDKQGDCDDQAIVIGALLVALGIPARLVAIGHDRYEHVYVEALVADCADCGKPEQWVAIDPIPTQTASWQGLNRRLVLML